MSLSVATSFSYIENYRWTIPPIIFIRLYFNTILKHSQKKNKVHSKLGLTERDIHELMSHSSYKRGYGGAIRQVR